MSLANPNPDLLFELFHFFYHEILIATHNWALSFQLTNENLFLQVEKILLKPTQKTVLDFIASFNGFSHQFDTDSLDFSPVINSNVWDIDINACYSINAQFAHNHNIHSAQILDLNKTLEGYSVEFQQALFGLQNVLCAPESRFLDQLINPVEEAQQKRHVPHIGLFFTFLHLFKKFQESSNKLTRRASEVLL